MGIFITGDTHGDFTRFKKKVFYEQAELTKDDCVMIAGDFGSIWDGSAEDGTGWTGWRRNPSRPCLYQGTMKTSTCWRNIPRRSGTAVKYSVSAPR